MSEQFKAQVQAEIDKLALASDQAVALSAAMRALAVARDAMLMPNAQRYIETLLPLFEDQITEISECGVDIMMMTSTYLDKPGDDQ